MNFNHLTLFHGVATHGSFTRAAAALFITQPAVSKQVQEMEKQLGVELFEQVGRKVHLTEAGRLLESYADRIFALSSEAEQALADLKGLRVGRLALGASMTVGVYILPELMGQFKTEHPGIKLHLDIANTEHIEQALLSNQLDLGIVEGVVQSADLVREPFREDQLVVIAPPQHPLAAKRHIAPSELEAFDFLTRESGSGTRAAADRAFAAANVKVRSAMELGSAEAIKRGVAVGLGLAVVSEHAARDDLAAGRLAALDVYGLDLRRQLETVHHRNKRLSQAARAFMALLQAAPLPDESSRSNALDGR